MMKKHFISFLLSLSMAAGLIAPSAVMKSASVYAAGGNMTLIAVQDTYVQGGSLINNNMGQETTLTGRDWSEATGRRTRVSLISLIFPPFPI